MNQPELIVDPPCDLGENPLWHPLEQRLYWTDITQGHLFRYDPATGEYEQIYSGEKVGGFTFQADGKLLLFLTRGHIATWQDGELETVIASIPGEEHMRFNDVIADPAGRVFCGSLFDSEQYQPGKLFRLEADGSLHTVLEGIGISNGLGFSPDRRHMYYTDSFPRRIYRFDYDEATGEITNQLTWLQLPEGQGVPDGMTVDAQGNIWSARWDGSALYQYSPEGQELQCIPFPARKVSSVTFGGADLTELYITTALDGGGRHAEGQGAGALFRLRLGMRGLPEFYSRVGL